MKVAAVARIVMEILQRAQLRAIDTALPYPVSGSTDDFRLQGCSDSRDKCCCLAVNAATRFDQTSERLHSRRQLPLTLGIGESGEPPEMPPVRAREITAKTLREDFGSSRTGHFIEHLTM